MREEPSSSDAQFTSTPETQLRPARSSATPLPPPSQVQNQTPESIQAQEEYVRALLRSQEPLGQSTSEQESATKLFSSLLGVSSPGGVPPTGSLPEDISSATGLSHLITNFFLGQSHDESPVDEQMNWVWNLLHVIFAFVVGLYLLTLVRSSLSTYGSNPPPPATAQNPFVVFVTGELLLSGTRILTRARAGQLGSMRPWIRFLGDISRDGSIAIFVFSVGRWWMGARREIESTS